MDLVALLVGASLGILANTCCGNWTVQRHFDLVRVSVSVAPLPEQDQLVANHPKEQILVVPHCLL